MRCISLWQPWASLIFTGDKKHETRSWRIPAHLIGEIVAIHATKALPKGIGPALEVLCEYQWGGGGRWRSAVPLGAVIGYARLVACHRTEALEPVSTDRVAGDWTPGRFAWELADTTQLPAPIPFRGAQGFFSVPDDLLGVTPQPPSQAALL